MKKNSLQFFTQNYYGLLIAIALVVTIALELLSLSEMGKYIYSPIWQIHLATIIITILSHAVTSLGLSSKTELHVYAMGGTAVRLFLSLIFIFIAVFVLKTEIVVFVLNFFILYLVYTSFEIYILLRNLRPDLKKEGKPS